MTLEIITWLYAGNSLFALMAYLPQITKLLTTRGAAKNFSTPSWTIWTYTSVISVLYIYTAVEDWLLFTVASINFVGCLAVLLLVLHKNKQERRE
ncbi:hypothetical protein KC902_02815 [Candidatus Kaiserbacteria bacterium]|nr:hypothetical protein [Candidatus Kaiserbacteria bacterium]